MKTFHTEKLVRERSGHVHNRLDCFSNGGWNLPHDLCPQLKHGQFIVKITESTSFKREH